VSTHIHPKSLPITPGWSQIGPRTVHRKGPKPEVVNESFRVTLNKLPSRRIEKLRHKLANPKAISETELILGVLDVTLACRAPRVFTKETSRVIEKKVVTNAA
jgi:hypothetical protein